MPKETDWIDELYRDGPHEEPPAELDRAIARAARAHPKSWYRDRVRLAGLSTAAVVLIAAVTLIVQRPPAEAPATAIPDAPASPAPQSAAEAPDAGRGAAKGLASEADSTSRAARLERIADRSMNLEAAAEAAPTEELRAPVAPPTEPSRATAAAAGPPSRAGCGELALEPQARYRVDADDANLVIVETEAGIERWRCDGDAWRRVAPAPATSDQQ